MSRGFAGGFGSAIGGGLFSRTLKRSLEAGFAGRGLPRHEELIRKLLGSPASVRELTGTEKEVAVQGYEHAVRMLFLSGTVLALAATVVQAGTGWHPHGPAGKAVQEGEDVESGNEGDRGDVS